MKTRFSYHFVMLLVSLFVCINSYGQGSTSPITIHVEKEGTLSSYIADSKKDQISYLKLSGCLNGTDFDYLRKMGSLEILDLKDISIVKGGEPYIYKGVSDESGTYYGDSYTTENNTISKYLFSYYKFLTKIIIPNTVEKISEDAFCSLNLKEIIVDDSHKYFSDIEGVLFDKDKTKLITYPCNANSSYTVPQSVLEISAYAFQHSGLNTVNIPYNVKTIGSRSFYSCESLTTVKMSNSVEEIGFEAFRSCVKLTSINISNRLKCIEESTFSGCKSLTRIEIPEGVERIDSYAFDYYIKTISIPSTMKEIVGLPTVDIEEIYCYASNPPIWNCKGQLSVSDEAVLYVPKGTYNAYWLSKGWGDFKNIVEMDYTPTSNGSIESISELNIISNKGGISIDTKEPMPIRLYDMQGQLIWSKLVDRHERISLSNGVYLIHYKDKVCKVIVY